jgi:hypothetical protein
MIKHMMEWVAHGGERLDSDAPAGTSRPSDCVTYRVRGYDFLLVRDGLVIISMRGRSTEAPRPFGGGSPRAGVTVFRLRVAFSCQRENCFRRHTFVICFRFPFVFWQEWQFSAKYWR